MKLCCGSKTILLVFGFCLVGLTCLSRADATGGFQGLGDLPGNIGNRAHDVSADGSVVVGTSWSPTGYRQAVRWTQEGGIVGLGDLPGGYFWSGACGVSADGSVVVGTSYSSSGPQAFCWTEQGGMVGLGGLAACGVSADGSIVVGVRMSAGGEEACRWTQEGGMVGLGGLLGGDFCSGAFDVSADGSVVVGYGTSLVLAFEPYPLDPDPPDVNTQQAFRWKNGTMTGLGFLPGSDYPPRGIALAVSADGSVVVGTGSKLEEAFR